MKRFAMAMAIGLTAACGTGGWAMAATRSLPASDPSGLALLSQARTAAGGNAWDRARVLRADGSIETSGLPGRWHRIDDLRRGRWAVHADVGVFRVADGSDGATHWRQDPSGGVHRLDAPFSRTAMVTDAWLTRRGWLRADAGQARIGAAASRVEDGRRFSVVEALPRGGQAVELWFDAGSRLLARTVRQMPISVQTVKYTDYRQVNGLQLPFTIESRDSGTSDVETVKVERWTRPSAQDASVFSAPTPPDDTRLAGETTVPLDIDGMVVLTARLNGKPFDFILDTGGHNIITPEVAQALGVRPVGSGASGGAGAGELAQQYVRIESLEIGSARMHDQHFYVMPFQYGTVERGPRPRLAGLIGLELFERLAVRIDYPGKKLTLRPFADVVPAHEGTAVKIRFDDDMPLIEGRIDGKPGLLAVDTGNSGTTVVQAVWAREQGLAERMKRGIETVSYGAGGASRNWASRVDSIEVGGQQLKGHVAGYAEDKAGAFSSRTEAANIGTDVLSHFVVDFDYSRGLMWFRHRPGALPSPFNRTGMRAMKEGPEAFQVVLVTPDSPASRAGIEPGDRIVAIDSVPAAELSGRDLYAKSTQPVGTEMRVDLQRGTTRRTATIKLAELLQ